MTTTEINYDQVFQLFISNDELRPLMCHPYKQGGKYYATDAHSMIILPIEKANLDYPEQDKPISDAVVPKETTCNIEIKISDLEAKLIPEIIDEIIEEEKEDKCEECDGDGEVEFEYDATSKNKWQSFTMEADCPICEGAGTITETIKKPTGKKIPNPAKKYKMFEVGFMYEQLKRLIDACNLLGVETITKTYGTPTNANIFKCGDAVILIMPAMSYEVPEEEFTVIF